MQSQLNFIKKNYIFNLGLNIISVEDKVLTNLKKIQSKKKKTGNSQPNSNYEIFLQDKLKRFHFIELEKQKITFYVLQKDSKFKNNTCNCTQANCAVCSEFFYNNILYKKSGEYFRKTMVVFFLLEKHFNKLKYKRNQLINRTSNKKENEILLELTNFLILKKHQKKKAELVFEVFFPSFIGNIAFIEITFDPISLSSDKEIVHPIFNEFSNIFFKNQSYHPNKNLIQIFEFLKYKIKNVLVIDQLYFSTTRTKKTKIELNFKKPNSIFFKQLFPVFSASLPFINPSEISQVFPDTCLSGNLLFEFYDLQNQMNISNMNKSFINLFDHHDLYKYTLSFNADSSFRTNPELKKIIKYGKKVHLFKLHGFGIFSSNLSMLSLLNKFKSRFPLKNQFSFVSLNKLVFDSYGKNMVMYALFEYQKEKESIDSDKKLHFQSCINEAKETGILKFDFKIPKNLELNTFHSILIETDFKIITVYEKKVKKLNLSKCQLDLIALRFQELFIYFDLHLLDFNFKNHNSLAIEQETEAVLNHFRITIINELVRFIVFEAVLITQIDWIKNFEIEKIQHNKKTNTNVPTIQYRNPINSQLEPDLSLNKYLNDSIFAFPSKAKDFYCKQFQNVVNKNIEFVEKI